MPAPSLLDSLFNVSRVFSLGKRRYRAQSGGIIAQLLNNDHAELRCFVGLIELDQRAEQTKRGQNRPRCFQLTCNSRR